MPLAKFETAWALADPNNISKFQISFPLELSYTLFPL